MNNLLTLEKFMYINGLQIQHSSEWQDYVAMNAQQAGMTSEEWMTYYGSEDGITESKKVSKKQLDKAIDALNKATKDLTIVLPKWQEARDKGDDQAQSTYLEELRDLTKKKQAAEKLVNQHIKDLDKDAELKITAESLLGDGIVISEGFTSKLNQIRQGAKNVGDFIKKTLSDAEFKMFGGNEKFELFLTDFYKVATESVEEGKKGLWANVHAKKKRGEKPAKPGDEDYPDEEAWKDAQESLDVNEAAEVTKEMWDKEWNIKKAYGKEFEEKFKKRIEAAMSKAKDEDQAEEWAYKNFKQLPNPAKGMTIEESVNEYGPLRGSGNRNYGTNDLLDRIGELDDILMNTKNRKASRDWDEYTEDLFNDVADQWNQSGKQEIFWEDIPDNEIQTAIDDAEYLMKKYRIKESTVNEKFSSSEVKKIKKKIENDEKFQSYFDNTGENYGQALEIWLEEEGDQVGVSSAEEAEELIDKLSESAELQFEHLKTLESFVNESSDYDKKMDRKYGRNRDYTNIEVQDIHFQMDPSEFEDMMNALGKKFGAVTTREKQEDAEYELKRFRKEIKYWDGNKRDQEWAVGPFAGPEHYSTVKSTLGAGPHSKGIKVTKWNQRKYDKWIETMAYDNDGLGQDSSYGFEMAQNATTEPGLIDWVKKNFRGTDPLDRIQWDIEAQMESINNTETMKNILTLESFSIINEKKEKYPITDRTDSDYKKLGAEWWFKCPFDEFKKRALGKPNFVTSNNVSDLDAEKWWRDQSNNHDGSAHVKILKMLDKYKGDYKGAGDRWEEFQSWIEQAMISQGNMIDAR
ncbi:MAG: hypothetical protein CMP57_03760 [Flavobacteriales bacterium]|nr:hypothetical protein [Flavobacteriales bacterium]|tara:strand:- start:4723 stop:7131 length:2409 start_codon:yes stop_codon:yes gene_type:complete